MSSLPKSELLRNIYWHSEILRVMYWLRGEGLGDLVDVAMLRHYLDLSAEECRLQLDGLVEKGSVVPDGSWYAISAEGLADGVAYATLFSDTARPARGPCSDECWCQMSSEEAAACTATSLQIGRTRRPPQAATR